MEVKATPSSPWLDLGAGGGGGARRHTGKDEGYAKNTVLGLGAGNPEGRGPKVLG